jgi:transposase-like protein
MSTTTKKDIVRGKRYTADDKSKIIAFIESYNAANGRGGQSAAKKKFGVSQLTVASWLKGAGNSSRGKSGGKGSMQNKLNNLLTLEQEIAKLDKELTAKRAKFEAIKASL